MSCYDLQRMRNCLNAFDIQKFPSFSATCFRPLGNRRGSAKDPWSPRAACFESCGFSLERFYQSADVSPHNDLIAIQLWYFLGYLAVDSTTLEANGAMKSIVRRDSGEDWKAYIRRLMQESGEITAEDTPSDEDLRRFDKGRKDKKVSNEEWVSQTDADAQITKMKDGTTHLAYEAEHVVDLASNLIVAA